MVKIEVNNLNVWYGKLQAIEGINLQVFDKEILGIIGPANSGKTTFLKCLNRLIDISSQTRREGEILLAGENINNIDLSLLRKKIGIVFALPIPLPMSIFENVAYGAKIHGIRDKKTLLQIVEKSLRSASLWDEVKDRINDPAINLSGGQQQRLCIARTLSVEPEVILYDEPCSGLDPISTYKIEETMKELKKRYTQILVTNNTKQAARVSDRIAFFLMGKLIEVGDVNQIFTAPSDKRTDDYISGRFG